MTALPAVSVAAVTPFRDDADLSVDREAYLHHLRWLVAGGVDGLVLFGTNGEGPSLSVAEKAHALEAVADAAPGAALIPTVAEANLPDALTMLRRCDEVPAAAVMVLPPYYFKPVDIAGLRAFYERALAATRHPLLVYHIPKYAVPIPAELVADLPVWGVKDSGGEPGYADAVRAAGRGVLLGTEGGVVDGLVRGAEGMISALANVVPEQVVALHAKVREGDIAEARCMEERLLALRDDTKAYASPGVLKRLAQARHGAAMGTVRPPLVPVPDDYDPTVVLERAGVRGARPAGPAESGL